MSLKEGLLLTLAASILGLIVIYVVIQMSNRKQNYSLSMSNQQRLRKTKSMRAVLKTYLVQAYSFGIKIPGVSHYILLVRKKLSYQYGMSEYLLRIETMKLTFIIWTCFFTSGVILMSIQPGISFLMLSILVGIVVNSLFLDMSVARQERKLLSEMVELFAEVRHRYHQHGMVEEALYEAAEVSHGEAARHSMHIYAALTSVHPDEALERYYETAPNRFLKAFAGISYMVMEFGDQDARQDSIYLKGIGSLTQEIHLEILRLAKLDYLLKGLNIISLAPVFFTKPIEEWARNSFPTMNEFYESKLGFIVLLSIYIIIIGCYTLLQQLQRTQETTYRAEDRKRIWEKRLYQWKWMRILVSAFGPRSGTRSYATLVQLLRETNTHLKLEWFEVRRIVWFTSCFLFAMSSAFVLHSIEKNHILNQPVVKWSVFGELPPAEKDASNWWIHLDQKVMEDLHMKASSTYEQIENSLRTHAEKKMVPEEMTASITRITEKLDAWNKEVFHWWELLICLLIAYIGYHLPIWLLHIDRRVRRMDMRHEVYQYQTVISILRDMDRMSVEEILEWLNRFAVIFKMPIQKCLLHFEHGPELALEQLKQEITLPEFQRVADKLILALGTITIKEAFDDLDHQMSFYFEQRRQEYAKMIETKAEWGRIIGFTPMYALIFLYLVLPLVVVSFMQMNVYYEQIQKI
ncbi:hypothetical protein [Paenibacillus sp. Marseille-Q4541]|uniref:hypothetical protein n=1 Tax=Paenibacillus sp. Marseille-Q4541 TaxID=2831522 RepID=UPI001BA6D8D2|nr:hypothetical protein [Paenibacillus sp. Marseille-Q4541]